MPGNKRFVFKPPHFPRFDSVAPSAIFNGDSRKLHYVRWLIHVLFAILFSVTCGLFASLIHARVAFGRNVDGCMGTLGEIHHSNDHSVTVVIPQISTGIFILTFAVVFISYNVLVQFIIVLTILEGVTFLVWKYQFPLGHVELDKNHFVRTVSHRMIKCYVVSNRTAVAEQPCWERFMADYCQEWAATEIRLCPTVTTTTTTTTLRPPSPLTPVEIPGRNNITQHQLDTSSSVMINLYNCYDRFMEHPWSNVTREEQYMDVLAPHVTSLMALHVLSAILLYAAARYYVREYRLLRENWIMELQMYYINLSNQVKEIKDSFPDCSVPWGRLIDKHVVWDPVRCEVCKDDPEGFHCRAWLMYPEIEDCPLLPTATMIPGSLQQTSRPYRDYYGVAECRGVANGDRMLHGDSQV